MTQNITRVLMLVCVSLQLLVIATSAFGVERVLGLLGGPMAPERRLLIAQVNIVLMAVGSVCAFAVGIRLAWILVALRRRDDAVGEAETAATRPRATTFGTVRPRQAAAVAGMPSPRRPDVRH